jgi:hypothetical protein
MPINLTAAARVIPLTALMLGACVSQSACEKQAPRPDPERGPTPSLHNLRLRS